MGSFNKTYDRFQEQVLSFETLKLEMNEFLSEMDHKLSTKQQIINQQEQDHLQQISSLRKVDQDLENQLKLLDLKEQAMRQRLEREMKSLESLKSRIENLIIDKATLLKTKEQLDDSIRHVNELIGQSKQELNLSNESLKKQMKINSIELAKYEIYSGLIINAIGINLISFGFTYIDSDDLDREFTIDLNISGEDEEKVEEKVEKEEKEEKVEKEEKEEKVEKEEKEEKVEKVEKVDLEPEHDPGEEQESGENVKGWTKITVERSDPELPSDFLEMAQKVLNDDGDLAKFLKVIRKKFEELAV